MAPLYEGVGNTQADDRRVIELQFLGKPADAIFDRDTKADDDIGPGKNPLQEDDDNLLDHHDQPAPGDQAPDRV